MVLDPQFIYKNGQKEFVVIPYDEFVNLQEILEKISDTRITKEKNNILINIADYQKGKYEDIKIWQYMKLDKLYSLLEEKKLFLSAVKNFDDPFEGVYTQKNIDFLNKQYSYDSYRESNSQFSYENLIESTFVSCWHINQYESDAMWKLYTESGKGIAIQSTLKKLLDSLNPSSTQTVYCGEIQYIDYTAEEIPINFEKMTSKDKLIPFMYKRKSFEFEKEFRLICNVQSSSSKGIKVECQLGTLIEDIYVSPNYNKREKNIVQTIVNNFKNSIGFSIEVQQSELAEQPKH